MPATKAEQRIPTNTLGPLVQTDLESLSAQTFGYQKAAITVQQSVTGMIKVIDTAIKQTHSGSCEPMMADKCPGNGGLPVSSRGPRRALRDFWNQSIGEARKSVKYATRIQILDKKTLWASSLSDYGGSAMTQTKSPWI
ncbi:hypothetical protein BDR22DRAFT_893569 [Usnea florida]